ncbi:hypothetical protein H4R33_005928, partial [Dimargaris cristalligena]
MVLAPITPSSNLCLPVVPVDYRPAIDLPLGKPRVSLSGYTAWVSGVFSSGLKPFHRDDFEHTSQLATAIILSRYYHQPVAAFAHRRGRVEPVGIIEQSHGSLQLVLAQMDPDTPVSPTILKNHDPTYPPNCPNSPSPTVEVVLHTDLGGTSVGHPMSEIDQRHGQPKEAEVDPYIADLLTKSTAHLVISCTLHQGYAQVTVSYGRALYRDSAVAEFSSQFKTVFLAVAQAFECDQPILVREIAWVSDQERARLLDFSQMTKPIHGDYQPFHYLFGDCAKRFPHQLALVHGGEEWTYGQLDYASSELARTLVNQYGARPEVLFALLIPKSIAYNVAILAVLKSGAAYVPLDPDYPFDRIQYILTDSDAAMMIVADSVLGKVPGQPNIPIMVIDPFVTKPVFTEPSDFQPLLSAPNDLAYVIYTSGTTGRPKGVLVEHLGVANISIDPCLGKAYGPGRRAYQTGSVAFDGILVNTLRCLCTGSTVVVPTDCLLDDLQHVNTGFLVTSFLSRLNPQDAPEMDIAVIGGESLLPKQQAQWAPHCTLANHYGPTEITVYCNVALIGPDDDITIGRPIQNVFNLVVDDDLQLVPVGVPGELLIGGVGVARGYQNLPELTAKKFISNPLGEGRVYRTGDYVRWLPSGTIELIGRIDNQIKLRGYRIEIEEIEKIASQFLGLKQCIAVVIQESLVIYASPETIDSIGLLDFLRGRLPKQMVPELIMPVEGFIYTTSGKLDRRSLPSVDHLLANHALSSTPRSDISAPQTDTEEELRRVWGQILQLDPDRISTTDHFFRIGGDSISAILLVSKSQQLGYQLTVPLIYQYPELQQLAQHTEKASSHQTNGNAAYQEQVQGEVALVPSQYWLGTVGIRNPHHFNQSLTLKVNSKANISLAAISDALVALANHHDILRARFQPDNDGQPWVQSIPTARAISTDFLLLEETVSTDDYADFILRVQSSLNLSTGPMLAAALIHDPDSTSPFRLFITIHHILVDLVAWRILIEDLNALLQGASLPPKTLPFQAWASQLDDYAATLSADIWPTQVDSDKPIRDFRALHPPHELDATRTQAARLSTSFEFDSESTQALLIQLVPQLRVTPRDLLLATFTQAFATTIGLDQVTFCMEGHGREPWLSDQDITRTVGWFTAIYPLVLRVQLDQPLLGLLHHTKEALQKIPMKGFPYSLLKHMPGVPAEERAKLEAKSPDRLDARFNYSEHPDSTGGGLSDDILSIEWSDHFGLHDFAPQDTVMYDIDIMPTVVGDSLRLIMEYNPLVYCRSVVNEIMTQWRQSLSQLANDINQSQSISLEPILTQYDFAHLQLSASELQGIINELHHRRIPLDQVEDLLPCIALQSGLLTGLSTDSTTYLVQIVFQLHGPLNVDRLLEAWQAVSQQHTILRTVFLEASSRQSRGYIQAVLRSCPTAWTISDLPLKSLDEFLTEDRRRGFTLQDHMIRNFVFPTIDSQVHDVIITFHHSLCDGWSLHLLLQAWMETYHLPNLLISNPSASFTSIVHHVRLLDSDMTQAFWIDYLKGAPSTPAPLLYPGYIGLPGSAAYFTNVRIAREQLTHCSQKFGVTLATLFRAAFALVLGHLLDQDEVVFGVTLSGRNLGLPGIDRTIGPCTNTLPLRVRMGHCLIVDWLQALHQGQMAMVPFEHSLLTDISKWASAGRSGPLFQAILGFENFPALVVNPAHSLVLSALSVHEFTEYPLAIDFIDGTEYVKVKLLYDTSIYSEKSAIQLDQLSDSLAGLSSQSVLSPHPTVVAVVERVEHLLICLVSAIKMGIRLVPLASPYTVEQLAACSKAVDAQIVWLPYTDTENVRPYLNCDTAMVGIPDLIDQIINETQVTRRFKQPVDLQDPSLVFSSRHNSANPVVSNVDSSYIQHTLASTRTFIDSKRWYILDESLPLDSPQAIWLTLLCLTSQVTITTPDSPMHENGKSSHCYAVAIDSPTRGSVVGDCLVLYDLAEDTWPHVEDLAKSTDTCLAFIGSIFHGHRRITLEQLASCLLPSIDKPPNDGYALEVLGRDGKPCLPGVVGRLTFLVSSFPDYKTSPKQPLLGYRDTADVVHILGPASQKVVINDRQIHLGTLVQALTKAGAQSPRCLVLSDDRLVVLVSNSTEADLIGLKTTMTPPGIPATLMPNVIISTSAFPHVIELDDQLLPHFAQAYLATLPTRSTQSLSEYEWWLMVVVNEIYASSNHYSAVTIDTVPLMSTSRIPLAQLDLLQYRIFQKFGIAVGLGELAKHTEIRTLAPIIQSIVKQGTNEQSPDSTVEDNDITSLDMSPLYTRTMPVTIHQQRVWSLSRLESPPFAFYHHCTITSEASLQLEEVQRAIDRLATVFESLRCRFISVRGALTCHVLPQVRTEVLERQLPSSQVFDGDQFNVDAPQFDLNQGVLVRFDLYQLPVATTGSSYSAIVIRVHEIFGSTSEFDEIVRALTNQLVGQPSNLPDKKLTRAGKSNEPFEVDLDYWCTLLQNPPAELAVLTDRPRPLFPSFLCSLAETKIEQRLFETIQTQASKESVMGYGIWSSLFATFLLRLTGQTDLIMDIVTPASENGDTSVDKDTLSSLERPLRVKGNMALDFPEVVRQLTHQIVDSRLHFLPSMDILAPHLSLEGQHRISGLSRTSVAFDHPIGPENKSTIVHCVRSQSPRTMFPYDIQLVVDCHSRTPVCQLRFNQSLFNVDTANRLLQNFLAYAHSVVVAHQPWSTASLVCPTEASLILDKFALGPPNSVTRDSPCLNVLDLFLGMVQKYPDRVATEIAKGTYTYAQLSQRVFGLVERLQRAMVQPRDKVGVIVANHPDAVMCMLAVWSVGAVYVPVDHKLPTARQKYIVDTAGCTCVVNASRVDSEWCEVITIDDLANVVELTTNIASLHPNQPTDLAYIVFTSGSTGLPKGVMVEHRSLLNMLTSPTLEMLQQPGTRTMNGMAAGFDVFFLNTLLPLCYGSTLVFYGDDLPGTLKTVQQTILLPSIISTLNPQDYTNLNSLLVGGEHLPRELANQWSAVTNFYNVYGPTEATIACLMTEVPPSGCVPIGRPMADYECYILDENLRLVPIGAVGEICIGGVGVTLGYINRLDLNLTKFADNSFTGQGKVYRTGDLGRWLPNGQVVCLGRMDSQVKLRGFRIELDEIRSVLMRQTGVQDCAVFVHDQFLVGYVFSDSTASEDVLRASVADQLPSYMVPSYILGLPNVPLTNNGKCNTQFLQNHFADHLATQRQRSSLLDSLSEEGQPLSILMQSLGETLGLPLNQINPDLSFVKIGGDSILAIQVSSKCRQLGFTLPTSALLGSGPLRDVIKKMSLISSASEKPSQFHPVEYCKEFSLTPIQQGFFDHPWSNPSHFNQSFALELTRPLAVTELIPALLRLINAHDMLRCQFTQEPTGHSDQWSQQILPPFAGLPIPVAELSTSVSDLSKQLLTIQSSLDINQGHHLAAGLITLLDDNGNTPTPDTSHLTNASRPINRKLLFLTIHHLVVDLVSWSVLLEDLARILNGQSPIPQPLKFSKWATELVDKAKHAVSSGNLIYPQVRPRASFLQLTGPDCLTLNTQANTQCQSIILDTALSSAILKPDTTYVQPLELMLAGLFQALHSISQGPSITVFNESHGRYPWQPSLDPSRTVGWFTSMVPCQIQVDANTAILDFLKQAKQALRSSSGPQGLQHGLYQLSSHPQSMSSNERPYSPLGVCFNYLDPTVRDEALMKHGQYHWTLRPELTANLASCDLSELRPQILEVVGSPTPGGLTFMVYYCPQVIPTSTIESLLDCVRQALKDIVQYLDLSQYPSLWTPSDFPNLNTTIPELAALETELATVGLTAHDVEDLYPMLPMQQGMWTATAKDPAEYLVQLAFTVNGVSGSDQLQTATRAVVGHHAILRTVFVTSWSNGYCQGVQVVTREPRFGWYFVNEWSDVGASSEEDFLQVNLENGFKPNESLLRIYVKRLAPNSFRYLLTIHHALIDGWSIGILLNQLRSHLQGNVGQNPSLSASFHDYVSYIQNSDKTEAERFWQEYMRDVEQLTELSLPRPPNTSDSCKVDLWFTLYPDARQLHQVTRQANVTPYTLIKAAWSLLLSRYTDQSDVVFGNTVSGRALSLSGIESLLGCFINTVPFRVSLKSEMTVSELMTVIHQCSQQMVPFEHLHLSKINEWVDGEVRPSDMFNTLVVYENLPDTDLESLEYSVTFTEPRVLRSSDYPLTVIAQVEHGQLAVNLNWSASEFDQRYIETLSHHLITLFSGLVSALANSDGQVFTKDLPMLSTSETALITEQLARPHIAIDFEACVPELFTRTAHSAPGTIAVEFSNLQWSYADLHSRSVNLAHRLLLRGIERGTPVGLIVDRAPSTIVAYMGVGLAGAVIVPIDPAFPTDRIQYMVDDGGIQLLLTNTADHIRLDSIRQALPNVEFQAIDSWLSPPDVPCNELLALPDVSPTDLSHILYTSGTTGRPKGVQLEHRVMANFVQQADSTIGITAGLRLMQNMALTFDCALLEIFTGLCKGATLVLRTDILDTLPLVNALVATPTVLASLDPSKYPNLKMAIAAGEALPRQVAERWTRHCRVLNMYGPTECFVCHAVEIRSGEPVTIGHPIPNTECYILDRHLQPVPIGVP